ncbi:MAG: LLM class F420-dependent oxidoreductase [Acidimicrobiia bacterium]|nr:LLM class F420-dependent oxidoreductase [Acidimicrobiia bacterium]
MRLRIFVEPQQGATYEQQLTMARLAEELGFDAFFRSDHLVRIGDGDPGPGPTDSWATLAALARETDRIRLGTLLTSATFRRPGPLAVTVAQVDAMSGGRVELGLGAGWYDTEHAAYGIPFPPLGERFERLGEQLAIVTGLWATPPGGRFTFEGRHYTLRDCPALPRPVQQPHPPIIVGGWGARRTPALAARYASEYNVPFPLLADFGPQIARVRAACEEAGRDPSSMVTSAALVVACGETEADFTRRAGAIGREPGELREHGLAGTVTEVVDRLRGFGAAGADVVYLQVLDLDDLDHVRLLASAVMAEVS